MDAFYTSFYSERERIENAAKAVDKALADLKIDIDPRMGQDAKAKFRKLIEDAMAAGDVELLAKLIPLAQEFGAVADAAGQVLDTLKNDRRQLEAEYLRATGQTDKYREALRKLATEGMSEAERAAWDYNQALREEIARLTSARTWSASCWKCRATRPSCAAASWLHLTRAIAPCRNASGLSRTKNCPGHCIRPVPPCGRS